MFLNLVCEWRVTSRYIPEFIRQAHQAFSDRKGVTRLAWAWKAWQICSCSPALVRPRLLAPVFVVCKMREPALVPVCEAKYPAIGYNATDIGELIWSLS